MIAPSILAGDLADLKNEVIRTENGGADLIHLDVMDGHFAPNITFGPSTIKSLRRYSKLPFDTHLMISDPLKYIDRFIEAGCDIISVHAEVCNDSIFSELVKRVNRAGKKIGMALNPDTEIPQWLMERLDELYLLNVMSVFPGFSGQKMIIETLDKMRRISKIINEKGLDVIIEADGGVDQSNAYMVVRAGARILVAGNAVYSNKDLGRAIDDLRKNAMIAEV